MIVSDIKKILVVGSGTMGQQIALQSAIHGYQVMLYSRSMSNLEKAIKGIAVFLKKLICDKRVKPEKKAMILSSITITDNPQIATDDVDLLSESMPEKLAVKKEVFSLFHKLCPSRTIFTTNTSSFIPSMYSEATGRPLQFAALHFHTYVWASSVVDIIPHKDTTPEVVALLKAFAMRIGQIPIILRQEHHNYVFNTLLSVINEAAISMVRENVVSLEDVDRAWRGIMKMSLGPFGMMDHVGLDTSWEITNYWAEVKNDDNLRANSAFLKSYIDQGFLGVKTGRGFYKYDNFNA